MADLYKQTSKGHDFSYTLKANTQYQSYDEVELRHTDDKVERKNIAFTYEKLFLNTALGHLKNHLLPTKNHHSCENR